MISPWYSHWYSMNIPSLLKIPMIFPSLSQKIIPHSDSTKSSHHYPIENPLKTNIFSASLPWYSHHIPIPNGDDPPESRDKVGPCPRCSSEVPQQSRSQTAPCGPLEIYFSLFMRWRWIPFVIHTDLHRSSFIRNPVFMIFWWRFMDLCGLLFGDGNSLV